MGMVIRPYRLFGAIAVVFVLFGATAVASAAARATAPPLGQWPASITHVRAPGRGCYQASYPASEWHAVACKAAPSWPLAPPPVPGSPSLSGPLGVGDGNDYAAVAAGTISQATGSFAHVSSGITEKGQINDQGPQEANQFTLQLNSQFFADPPACSASSNPASCLGWEQFVYETDSNTVYMQYWLIRYYATCPSGWWSYYPDCYTNSPANSYGAGPLTAAKLASVKFVGRASSGGEDSVSLSAGSGAATLVSNSDDMVDLAQYWNTSEFDLFGDAGGGEAVFGPNTTLDPVTAIAGSSSGAPTCKTEGFTAETNNLSLSGTPTLAAGPSPAIESAQTDGRATTASCTAVGASSTPSITNPGPQPASGHPAEAAGTAITPLTINAVSYTGAQLAYGASGLPPGLEINPSDGVISGIPTRAGTYSVKVTVSAGTRQRGDLQRHYDLQLEDRGLRPWLCGRHPHEPWHPVHRRPDPHHAADPG